MSYTTRLINASVRKKVRVTSLIAHTKTDKTAALVHVGVYNVNVFSITWVQAEARVSNAVKSRTSWVQSFRGKNG